MTMKKAILAAVALAALSQLASAASSVTVCGGGLGGKVTVGASSGTPLSDTTTHPFLRSGFEVQCSNNVHMAMQEVDSTLFVVGSASAKGNQYFGGSSNGGAVKVYGQCAAGTTCAAVDAASGVTAATTAASGSS
jgi:hypothetical protein